MRGIGTRFCGLNWREYFIQYFGDLDTSSVISAECESFVALHAPSTRPTALVCVLMCKLFEISTVVRMEQAMCMHALMISYMTSTTNLQAGEQTDVPIKHQLMCLVYFKTAKRQNGKTTPFPPCMPLQTPCVGVI